MKTAIRISPLLLLFFLSGRLFAQDFMLQSWYWQYPEIVGGKPYATRMANRAAYLESKGFTQMWVPPMSVGSSGPSSMGYDPKDLYDIGQYASKVRLGKRNQINDMVDSLHAHNIQVIGDFVLNHRDAGRPEDNSAAEGWIENLNNTKVAAGDQAYPSDRFRCYLPLGTATGNGVGKYYFKIRSASQNSKFYGKQYEVYMTTNTKKGNSGAQLTEVEPNGGGNCSQSNDTILLGRIMKAGLDNSGCGIDEFMLDLAATDFSAAGDTLWITLVNNPSGLTNYSDQYVFGLWSTAASADIQNQIKYQTYTDFNQVPSGRGKMNYLNFRPNGKPTSLGGDEDAMLFFYDYDQTSTSTRDTLYKWVQWMHDSVGVDGLRLDAVKHFPAWFTGDLLDYLYSKGIKPNMVVGEYFDYSATALKAWTDAVMGSMDAATKAEVHPRLFDFALRNVLKSACDVPTYDVRTLYSSGMHDGAGASGFNIVTFVDNHDLEEQGSSIKNHPELAYAYILTNNQIGSPCVFEGEYYGLYTSPNKNVRGHVNALMEAHKRYIFGANLSYYLNAGAGYPNTYTSGSATRSLIYQLRSGISQKDVVVAINFSDATLKVDQGIETTTSPAGTVYTDIFRVSPNPTTTISANGRLSIELPPNSFGIWVKGDLTAETIVIEDTQTDIDAAQVLESNLVVYPNPSTSVFYLTLPTATTHDVTAQVMDLSGRMVLQTTFPAGQSAYALDASSLPQGTYVLQVAHGGAVAHLRIIKE